VPQDPEQIQRQIEATRSELASTVEQIADRVSPKKVAARGAATARTRALEAFETARAKAAEAFTTQQQVEGPNGEYTTRLQPRWDRVGGAGGLLVLLVLARVWAARRRAERARSAEELARVARRESAARAVAAARTVLAHVRAEVEEES